MKGFKLKAIKKVLEKQGKGEEPGRIPVPPSFTTPAKIPQQFRIRTVWEEKESKATAALDREKASLARRSRESPAAMGTGSSKAGKARSLNQAKCWRGPGPGSRSHSAPSRPGQTEDEVAADAAFRSRPPRAASQSLEQPDSDSELLDQVLQECDDDGHKLLPSPRRLLRPDAGDSCARPAEGSLDEDGSQRELPEEGFLARSTPESFANQLPLKKPERQARISYDYSEEELMATIEQEYCR